MTSSPNDPLRLGSQLCFPVYAASRLITREYQPYLDELGITYPQYLVLMVLWEKNSLPVNEIARKLVLNTNTVTPLLKRMESQGLLRRSRSTEDERVVTIALTKKGRQMREQAGPIPEKLAATLLSGPLDGNELTALKRQLDRLVGFLSARGQ